MQIDRLLCPVDFSEASRHAIGYATALAEASGARVIGLHVHQPALASIPAGIGRDDPVFEPSVAGSPEVRRRIAAQFDGGRTAVPAELAVGAPAEVIAQHARSAHVDLIVIGTRGAGGLQHLLLGSVTEDVIRKSSVPVLAIPPGAAARPRLPLRRLLCATDFSAASLAALSAALRLAEAATQVTVLHVIDDPGEHELFLARPYDVHRHPEALELRVRETLAQVTRQPFEGRGAPDLQVVHGPAAGQILAAAAAIEADLIVMGVHGRNALDVAIFGSTTNDVVRRAHSPVLTARQ